jgi:Flp pilus assembly CpaE family ATPase
MSILNEIQDLFLVSTTNVQALYETKRVLAAATASGMPAARLHLVLNRMNRHSLVSRGEVEKALGINVAFQLPDCEQELEEAYADGDLLGEGNSLQAVIAQAVAKTAGVTCKPAEPRKRRLFSLTR